MKLMLVPFLLLAVPLGGQAPPDHFLDVVAYLTTPDHSQSSDAQEGLRGGVVSRGTGEKRSGVNMELRFVSLEGRSFQWGDSFEFQVMVSNVGTEPVVLPWSPDPLLFEESERSPAGSISIQVLLPDGQRVAWLWGQPLYGSKAVSGTQLNLEPGRKALIRLPGMWTTTAEERARVMRSQKVVDVRIAATLTLRGQALQIKSRDEFEVRVGFRPAP